MATRLFRDVKSHFFSHQSGCTEEALVGLLFRLQRDYGVFSTVEKPVEKKAVLEIYDFITQRTAELLTADTSAIYLYKHDTQKLSAQSLYYGTDSRRAKQWREKMPDCMAAAAIERRQESICYRAIDSADRPLRFVWKFDPITRISDPVNEPLLLPPDDMESARSGMAVPLMIHGHRFGALEVGGFSPYQFCYRNLYLLDRIGTLVGPYLYQKHVLRQLELMNSLAHDISKSEREKYDAFCELFSNIFLARSSRIWIRDRERPDYFKCVGSHNIEFLRKKLDVPSAKVAIPEKGSFVADAVTSEEPYMFKPLESSKFYLNDLKVELSKLGVRGLCIVPIKRSSSREKVTGIVSLDYRDTIGFSDPWRDTFFYVSRQFAVYLEAMQSHQEVERRIRQILNHELKQKIDGVIDRANTIYRITRNLVEQTPFKQRARLFQSDLKSYTKEAHQLFEFIETNDFSRLVKENQHPIFELARRQIETERPDILDLRREFFEAIKSRRNDIFGKKLSSQYLGLPSGPLIRIHKSRMKNILDNLVDNAIKYSENGSTITARVQDGNYVLFFSISNVAQCLTYDEQLRLFSEGFRSEWAKAMHNRGEGQGLFITKGLCEVYGIDLQYESNDATNKCTHTFTLAIPKETMVLKKEVSYGRRW